MRLQNISANQIVIWAAMLSGMFAAVVLGSAVGTSDMRLVAALFALVPIAVIFTKLKTNIWVLFPIGWFLTGRLTWLPLPFTVRDLCFMTVIFFFLLFFATRAITWKRKFETLDVLIIVNLVYLVSVYFRNPVGFWAIQSTTVGGRPYFEIILAFAAYLILSRVSISDAIANAFPFFFVVPAWGIALLDTTARLLPQLAQPIASFYDGVNSGSLASVVQQPEERLGETRMTGMQFAGISSVLTLCAKYNPITLISPLFPRRVILLAISFGAIFLSGFRSALFFAFVAIMLSALLRGRIRDLWIAGGVVILSAVVLISLQGTVLQLPKTMQRALSWLPGDWDSTALADAEGSSQWRYEMWGWAWNDERILRDRVWGQGFGLSLEDMSLIANSILAGQDGASLLGGSDRENFMITGSFHSGPLSTIKFIGIVGFCLYYPLMCYMALAAWRVCKSARGTKALPLALFVGLPIIYEPFNFIVIFGGLDSNYPQLLFWAGLLNMVSNYTSACQRPDRGSASALAPETRDTFAREACGPQLIRG